MRCLKKREIIEYIDKELAPKRLEKIETHLETCSQCQVQVKKAQKEIQSVQQHFLPLNPIIFPESHYRSLKAHPETESRHQLDDTNQFLH